MNYTFQNTSNTALVRVPPNSVTAKLYYTGSLFNNNLQLQVGTQLQVYQEFYTYNYMPATQAFYLQNSFKTESYPFVDVFLNARIRPVAFFLKMENALSGLAGTIMPSFPVITSPPGLSVLASPGSFLIEPCWPLEVSGPFLALHLACKPSLTIIGDGTFLPLRCCKHGTIAHKKTA